MDRDQTILTEDGSSEEPPKVFVMCERCKVALKRIELKGLYQCPMCFTVTEQE